MDSLLGVIVSQSRSLNAGISGSFLVGASTGVGGISEVENRRLNLFLYLVVGQSSTVSLRQRPSKAARTAHPLEDREPWVVAEKLR